MLKATAFSIDEWSHPANMPPPTLICWGIGAECSKVQIYAMFESFGRVERVEIVQAKEGPGIAASVCFKERIAPSVMGQIQRQLAGLRIEWDTGQAKFFAQRDSVASEAVNRERREAVNREKAKRKDREMSESVGREMNEVKHRAVERTRSRERRSSRDRGRTRSRDRERRSRSRDRTSRERSRNQISEYARERDRDYKRESSRERTRDHNRNYTNERSREHRRNYSRDHSNERNRNYSRDHSHERSSEHSRDHSSEYSKERKSEHTSHPASHPTSHPATHPTTQQRNQQSNLHSDEGTAQLHTPRDHSIPRTPRDQFNPHSDKYQSQNSHSTTTHLPKEHTPPANLSHPSQSIQKKPIISSYQILKNLLHSQEEYSRLASEVSHQVLMSKVPQREQSEYCSLKRPQIEDVELDSPNKRNLKLDPDSPNQISQSSSPIQTSQPTTTETNQSSRTLPLAKAINCFWNQKQKISHNQPPSAPLPTSKRDQRAQARKHKTFFFDSASPHSSLVLRTKALTLTKSSIHAFGIFAGEPIEKGEFVIEYVGEIVRDTISNMREKYVYSKTHSQSSYLFRIDKETVIDATLQGNLARFMNHSCDATCVAKILQVEGRKRICVYAKRALAPGDEITYDYKFPLEDEKIPCLCGAANCRGSLN